jgi:eukaryotic-like serine/threonine-protein kinase
MAGASGDLLATLRAALEDRYEIEGEIGQGGFAIVYLARDRRHDRRVALKVFSAEPTSETGELRFLQEIRLLARLQHPNILPLLDSGRVERLLYFLMPYVSGETLRARMNREGQLPIQAAIRISSEVGDALAYAHGQGVIHRDIKPENILISGGHAVVADFGIARAIDVGGVQQLTRTGAGSPGTPAYMSPEQLLGGREVDGRTDIYSLGCVLYEMLTGNPPYAGKDGFTRRFSEPSPRPSVIRKDLPRWLDAVVEKMLSRDPDDRYGAAEDFARALSVATTVDPVTGMTSRQEVRSRLERTLVFGAGAAVLLVGSLIASRYLGGNRPEFEISSIRQVTNDQGVEITPALSPDGKLLAYAGGDPSSTAIFIRPIDGGEAIRLTRGRAPQWSPDGTRIAYVDSTGSLATVSPRDRSPRRLVSRFQYRLFSPVWSHDGKALVYTENDAVWIADADGSAARKILTMKEPHSISWSPDDSRLVMVDGNRPFIFHSDQFANISPSTLWIAGRDGKRATAITDQVHHNLSPVWTTDGEGILYVSNFQGVRDLYYQRVSDTKPDGPPRRLTTGLGIHGIAIGRDGRIAYSRLNTSVGIWSMPFPRAGTVSFTTGRQITSAVERIETVSLSPDGNWLAFDSDRSGNMDIYKMRVDGTGLQQLTRSPGDDFHPTWSPDGRQIAFHSWRSGNRDSYVMSADGGSERAIAVGPAHEWAGAWSPDGSKIAFQSNRFGDARIFIMSASGGDPRQVTSETASFSTQLWSPDGAFIAYGGKGEGLNVVAADGGPEKVLVPPSTFGPVTALGGWSSDSRKIYFRARARNGDLNVAQVSVDGSNPSLIVRFDQPDRRAYRSEFTTDGKILYFTVGRHEADIWVMDLKKK